MKFISSNNEITNKNSPKAGYFNEYGEMCEEQRACAESSNGKHRVLQSLSQRKIFNPVIDDMYKKQSGRKEMDFKMTLCTKSAFDNYLDFLKTKNPLSFRKAEMEINR